MSSDILNAKAIRKIVETCAGVKEGEVVTIVTDPEKKWIAEQLAFICSQRGAEVLTCIMSPRQMHNEEIPEPVKAAMCKSQVVFAPTTFSIAQTTARRAARESGVRFINMPDYSMEVLQSQAFELDFKKNVPRVRKVAEALTKANLATLTSKSGTDFEVSLTGRTGLASLGMALSPGESASPPDVESAIAPVEGSARGILVINGSIPAPGIGLLANPVRVKVERGEITHISGGQEANRLERILREANSAAVYRIGELGIGLNPKAELIGYMLLDEGCEGTVHIGIGTNVGMGGEIRAPLHLDLIMKETSLFLDGKALIDKGVIILSADGGQDRVDG